MTDVTERLDKWLSLDFDMLMIEIRYKRVRTGELSELVKVKGAKKLGRRFEIDGSED